jgi:NAD(P)-dependent dehydrogenase (short-subunit alcohol dehydrogenase family)
MPPPRWVQKINAVLHSEPLASLVYGLYWSLVLILSFPLVLSVLWGRTIGRILVALLWPETATTYDPSRRSGSKHDDSEKQEWAVVITGCDTGFGRELALRAADKGYIVFAGCLHPSSWKDESATILTKGTIFPLPMDVTKDDQVQNAVAKVKAWLTDATTEQPTNPPKRILHAVINNAGVGLGGLVDWTEMSTFQYCLDGTCCTYFVWCQCSPFSPLSHRPRCNFMGKIVNYLGMIRVCKAFLPLFQQQAAQRVHVRGAMRILNVTSMAGLVASGTSGLAAYGASKHAANAFSTVLRTELAGFGISVTTINPSFHATPLVKDMGEQLTKVWNNLEDAKRKEYGQGACTARAW